MKNKPLVFNPSSSSLSLGVELELQVLDEGSLLLTPRANEIIEDVGAESLKKEFFQSTLEIVTGVCGNVHNVKDDLLQSLRKVHASAGKKGLKISSTGTHPEADYRERLITPSARYNELADRNKWLIRRMAVYGMHIHVGITSADEAIRFNNFLLHLVPHVLALSASSPFWQRMDTGLAAARPTMYEAMPTSGSPYLVKNWSQFQKLYNDLLRSGSIESFRDLWWDVRPSPVFGTVELRVCDEPARFSEIVAIVAFVHVLAHWFRDHADEWEKRMKGFHRWMLRENKWRVIRHGRHAEIINQRVNHPVKLTDDILYWIEQCKPYTQELQYDEYINCVKAIVENGNSSERQYAVYKESGDLHDVTKFNVREFEEGLL
jgi:carboxylate-amine ligase